MLLLLLPLLLLLVLALLKNHLSREKHLLGGKFEAGWLAGGEREKF